MREFDYLACDGGPHLVLPKELSAKWSGGGSMLGLLSSANDYRRACTATATQNMTVISVGLGHAMVMANPPLSAWGHSPEGWIDIYDLQGWRDTNTDTVIKRAVAATPTSTMTNTGHALSLTQPGLLLLFAGDKAGNTAYGEHAIPAGPGAYQILEGHYKTGAVEEVYIYRLQPRANPK